jgi:hypothetical protein
MPSIARHYAVPVRDAIGLRKLNGRAAGRLRYATCGQAGCEQRHTNRSADSVSEIGIHDGRGIGTSCIGLDG